MTKQAGFLTQKLGQIVVFCNRSQGGLWYVIEEGKEKNLDAQGYVSFQSVENGLKGLTIYKTIRYQEEVLKMALILEGEEGQIYKFETGIDTVFARGMLWGLSQMTEEDAKGRIGLNPQSGEDMDSRNAKSLLFCNLFVNGVEMQRLPNGEEAIKMDWQQIAHKALSVANRCDYPIAEVPHGSIFWGKTAETLPLPQKSQPARQQATQGRSGVSYPQQPSKTQTAPANNKERPTTQPPSGLQAVTRNTIEPTIGQGYTPEEDELSGEELSIVYDDLMLAINEAYQVNGMQIDENRIQKVLDHSKVTDFSWLSIPRKHQIVCTLAKELVEAKQANHSAVAQLSELIAAKPVDTGTFELLKAILLKTFGVTPNSTEAGASDTSAQTTNKNLKDADIPF